jgi:hypothetical protein
MGKAMPNSGVGRTVGNLGKKAIDMVLDKIKEADVIPGLGGPAGSAIALLEVRHREGIEVEGDVLQVQAFQGFLRQRVGLGLGVDRAVLDELHEVALHQRAVG